MVLRRGIIAVKVGDMTQLELMEVLEKIKTGEDSSGIITGKSYVFLGVQISSGKGRYHNLKGEKVVVLYSKERKRSNIILFINPLLSMVNADSKALTYGHVPREYYADKSKAIPNFHEYLTHYKVLVRYIQNSHPLNEHTEATKGDLI